MNIVRIFIINWRILLQCAAKYKRLLVNANRTQLKFCEIMAVPVMLMAARLALLKNELEVVFSHTK